MEMLSSYATQVDSASIQTLASIFHGPGCETLGSPATQAPALRKALADERFERC
jgi:hypothetical protein